MTGAAPTHHDGSQYQRNVEIRGEKRHLSCLGADFYYVGIRCGIIEIRVNGNLVSSQ